MVTASRGRSTKTSTFGVSQRVSHDASGFYDRFDQPDVDDDERLGSCSVAGQIICGDARDMSQVADRSVALVVTSPPYFAGKDYELDGEAVPETYDEYLELLAAVLGECWRVLEPGGRIAVNVANLGRRPYRSLSADVSGLLVAGGYLLRGEIVWVKATGAGGNCAWGSFASASNPVLRDVSERIIVASKGRFDRAVPRAERRRWGLPWENTISKEDFMAWTLDVWNIAPASARRIGHPAPFPQELPRRLIELYSYADDVVLDPFMGAGQTAIAAATAGRRWVGYELDEDYAHMARGRIDAALTR